MEFQIRNSYIKKFLGGFAHQNELKIIKYLTILGIHYLDMNKKFDITFAELRKMAKSITKNVAKEDKLLNKELIIIKKELVKLSQKFEEKIKEVTETEPDEPESANPKSPNNNGNQSRSQSVPKKTASKTVTKKPPSQFKAGQHGKSQDLETQLKPTTKETPRRASSIDPADSHHRASKLDYNITPKPTEIVLPFVDPRENRNYVTRHHLDDSQAKNVLGDQGVHYMPTRKELSQERLQNAEKKNIPERSRSLTRTPVEKDLRHNNDDLNVNVFHHQRKMSEVGARLANEDLAVDYRSFSRSPKFAPNREETFVRGTASPFRDQRYEKETDYSASNVPRSYGSARKPAKAPVNKNIQTRFGRDKIPLPAKSNRSHLNQTHLEGPSGREYQKVESKIRDEVKYHKELSRQYKKMKKSIQDYSDNTHDKFSNASSSRRRDREKEKEKFVLVEKDEPSGLIHQHPLGQTLSNYQRSGLMESSSSPQRSFYLKQSSGQYSNKSPTYSISLARSKRSDIPEQNENFSNSQSKNSASASRGFGGGMLDIANSFLNSPFMQHLSNMDGKSSQISPGSSLHPSNSDRHHYREQNTGNFDNRHHQPIEQRRSPKKVTYATYSREEDIRPRETHQNYSRYSDWVGNYKADKGTNNSILRESGNRRYADDFGKESVSMYQNKNEGASFTSSNFSNFLNDEMKGFFQKETMDLKRPKQTKSAIRGSVDSSHISINPNDVNLGMNREDNNPKKSTQFAPSSLNPRGAQNRTFIGGDLNDNGNVFKQERMSVTHLLNTS